jgi:hypothetical protein
MKIHYFQRYHQKENVYSANTMFLISRLYSYSSKYFYDFLSKILPANAQVEPSIKLQVRNSKSVPDAVINQESFKIVLEAKRLGDFDYNQLYSHLSSFSNEEFKVLLTLDPKELKQSINSKIDSMLFDFNNINHNTPRVFHKHLTFEAIIQTISDIINFHDLEFSDVLEDYRDFCSESNLLFNEHRLLKVRTVSDTFVANCQFGLYYERSTNSYSNHKYLGLYFNKSVRAIGEVVSVIRAKGPVDKIEIIHESGKKLPEDMKFKIGKAIEDSTRYVYDLVNIDHRYFFVEKLVATDFQKTSSGGLRTSKFFNLCNLLNTNDLPDNIETISDLLRNKTW